MAHHTGLTRPTVSLEPDIAGELDAGFRRNRRRFRIQVLLVWAILISGLVGGLIAIDEIDPVFISTWAPFILGGAGLTIVICIGSILLATVLAVLGALGRLSTNPIIYGVASLYVSLVRGTPLHRADLIFAFYALPQLGIVLPALQAGIIALGFNYGAYMTEIFRAGIQAVPRGQREAAEALAMPERLVMRRIVSAPGHSDRDPGHRQRVHRDDQGLGPGVHHRRDASCCGGHRQSGTRSSRHSRRS